MNKPEQGEVIRISGASSPFLVVSQDYFNDSGLVVVCPIVKKTVSDALHVPVRYDEKDGFVLCENITSVSAESRGFTRLGRISAAELPEIIYRVQSIFDFFHI